MRPALQITREGAVAELKAALRGTRKTGEERRLRVLLAVAGGAPVPQVAKLFGVAERAARNWVQRYNRAGLEGLRDRRAGRKCRLSAEQLALARQRLNAEPRPEDGVSSLRGVDVGRILHDEFGVKYARSSVYYFLHHTLRRSYVKPRPQHVKSDLAAQETFNKTSQKRSRKSGKNTPSDGSKSGSKTKAASANKAR